MRGNEKHKEFAPERGPVGPCSHFRRALGTRAHCRDTAGGISRCFSDCRALAPMCLHFPPWLLLALSVSFPGIDIWILVLNLLVYVTTGTPRRGAP